MTAEQSRVTIAEACGYVLGGPDGKPKSVVGWERNGKYIPVLPNFPESLNAMAEAEKVLLDTEVVDRRSLYWDYLCLVVGIEHDNFEMQWKCLRATAAQKTEAMCRTFKLWEKQP